MTGYRRLLAVLAFVAAVLASRAAVAQPGNHFGKKDESKAAAEQKHDHSHRGHESGKKPDENEEKSDAGKGKSKDGGGEKKDGEKKNGEKKDGEKKDGEKKSDDTPKPVLRPDQPPQPPDPDELKVRPDAAGKIKLSFSGQPWPDVLRWLADVSKMSLDWQELPGGFLNLTTQQSYTVEEVRDLVNRHLLARGYTLIRHDEVLSVVKVDKLNPGMVPRVAPEELAARDPHEFVKVSFPLQWLTAERAAEELKPMLSPNGKLSPLGATNRLEAVDAVINLRGIHALLREEQSGGGKRLVREFKLQHTRAEEVCKHLRALCGLEDKSSARPMTPDQIRRMQEAMMRAQHSSHRSSKPPSASKARPKSPVSLVVNQRNNSILVQAPPDKMATIAQAVELLDAPSPAENSLLANLNRMQIYRLAAIDPEPLVKTLEELGELDPGSRLEVDKKNKAIIAYATLADHVTIRALIEKLDGSTRQFEVIRLRRLAADYVAGTIEFMMGGGKKEKKQQRSHYWDYYSYRSRNQSDENQDKFRVDADVEHNRLLLWANEIELQEVRNLLVKLGEIPPKGGNRQTVRVIDALSEEETEELLRRLKSAWPTVAPNPLQVTPPKEKPAEEPKPDEATPEEPSSTTAPLRRPNARFAQFTQPQPEEENDSGTVPIFPQGKWDCPPGTANPPPVSITRGPDGRLVIASRDTHALDLLEELMAQLAPSRRDYEIFPLKHAWAYGLALTLEDIFEEDEEDDSRRQPYWYHYDYGYGRSDSDDKGRSRLSDRRPLKFISDTDTNSILVQNASPDQLKKIKRLVEFYDRPEPTDSQSVRKSRVVTLRYSKVGVVAEAIKEVYRDLLSVNDKSFAKTGQGQRTYSRYTYIYSSGTDDKKAPRFKGLLSVGVDELSNTLIVSAPMFLLDDVVAMVENLDEAARPVSPAVRVVKVIPGITPDRVREALSKVTAEGGVSGKSRGTRSSKQRPKSGSNRSSRSRSRSRSSR